MICVCGHPREAHDERWCEACGVARARMRVSFSTLWGDWATTVYNPQHTFESSTIDLDVPWAFDLPV